MICSHFNIKMMTIHQDIHTSWSIDIEHSLERLRIAAILRSQYHKNNYVKMLSLLKYFRIPIIILSATSSVFNVALTPYMQQQYISLMCCFISLVAGLIGSIELFLQIQKTMENDLINSKDFYLISIDICKMLQLTRPNRNCHGRIFLDENFNMYKKLVENSVITDRDIYDNIIALTFIDTMSDIEKIKLINENMSISKIIDMRNENYQYGNNFLQNIQKRLRDSISNTPRYNDTPRLPTTPHHKSSAPPRTSFEKQNTQHESCVLNLDLLPKKINRKQSLCADDFFISIDKELQNVDNIPHDNIISNDKEFV